MNTYVVVAAISVLVFGWCLQKTITLYRRARKFRTNVVVDNHFLDIETASVSSQLFRKYAVARFFTIAAFANLVIVGWHFPVIPSIAVFCLEVFVTLGVGWFILILMNPLNPFVYFIDWDMKA